MTVRNFSNDPGDDRASLFADSNFIVGNYTYVQDKYASRQINIGNTLTNDSKGRVWLGRVDFATALWADPSASVDLNSSVAGGTLRKSSSTAERLAISNPADGLLYDRTLHTLCFYNGTKWQKVTSSDAD